MKKPVIILSICIMASMSSFGTPTLARVIGVDTISFQFSEKDIEDSANYLNIDYPYIDDTLFLEYNTKKPQSYEEAVQYFRNYLFSKLRYPSDAQALMLGETVICDFIIEADGTISNFNVSQSHIESFGIAIKRVVNTKWFSGAINSNKVPVFVQLQVTFEIYRSFIYTR